MTPFRLWLSTLLVLSWLLLGLSVGIQAKGLWLACPDWPTCFGLFWPVAELPEAVQARFPEAVHQPLYTALLLLHRWLELFLAAALLITTPFALRLPMGLRALFWGELWFLAASGQLLASWWIHTSQAAPLAQTAHFLALIFGILAGTRLLLLASKRPLSPVGNRSLLRASGRLLLFLALLQALLGNGVAVSGAGLACPDFPTCYGSFWPPLDGKALAFWKGTSGLTIPPLQERITFHWLHRLGALLLFMATTAYALALTSLRELPLAGRLGRWLTIWLFLEIAFGILLIRFELPLPLRLAHALGGVLFLQTLAASLFALRWTVPAVEEAVAPEVPPPFQEALFDRLRSGLGKTRGQLAALLTALPGRPTVDEALLEEIETHLLLADVGVETTQWILDRLKERLKRDPPSSREEVLEALRQTLLEILEPCSRPLDISRQRPFVILVVGVNGVGKTTTIGKLAWSFKRQGKRVVLAAADTFRAAAIDQLKAWGERVGVPVVAQQPGADPAAVAYDALEAARARGYDLLIIDTAGRLHTKSNLMEELAKIERVLKRLDPTAPHEVLLVLDATIGQNALVQAEEFMKVTPVTGIVLTKLDGTAKGGVIFALARRFKLPIRFIGVGEGVEDLQPFDARLFIEALLPREAEVVH